MPVTEAPPYNLGASSGEEDSARGIGLQSAVIKGRSVKFWVF